MIGMNALTGKPMDGIEHLRQSIADILLTPIGSRVFLREYGSDLFNLIDAPINRPTIASIINASATAIARWEPRLKLEGVKVLSAGQGTLSLDISGTLVESGLAVNFLVGI